MVGNLNSSVSQQTQPVFSAANITQVSPANTNPTLTRGADLKARPDKTYFRTCTNDIVQGGFAAKYLLDQGIKTVATIHDKKTYGQGLVSYFTEAYKKGGGKSATLHWDDSAKKLTASGALPTGQAPAPLVKVIGTQ